MTLTHTIVSARGVVTSRILAAGLLALLLAACASPRPSPPPVPVPAPERVEITPLERAQLRLIEAEASPEPALVRDAIDAVLALDEPAGDLQLRAERLWSVLPEDGRGTLSDRYRGARLALLGGEAERAFARLPPVEESRDAALYRDAFLLYAELLTAFGPRMDALMARMQVDDHLFEQPDLQLVNQQTIWQLLATLDREQLRQVHAVEEEAAAAGWAALFRSLSAAGTDPDAFAQAVEAWARVHPRHPAQALITTLQNVTLRPAVPPQRIAALLPLSGPLSDLGNAVLEGVAAEFYQNLANSASLLVFDTGGQADLAEAAYRNALQQGADRVIGPLVRDAVDRVATIDSSVPTLLLNRPSLPLQPTGPFWVLSLSPEDDARAAAQRAIALGSERALVLVPEGAFGDRVASAFAEYFERQARRVAAAYRFNARAPEINASIGAALGIEASEQRIAGLRRQLGLRLEADSQIRADIDVIFVAGPARDLRLVVPHLHYHRAGRLPMLATSHIYEGHPQPALDGDLSGVRFPDAPWLHPELNPEPELLVELAATEEIETAAERLPRFAALGIDAMRVVGDLPRYRRAPHLRVPGTAGTWHQQPYDKAWIREPVWLEFNNGLARPARRDVVAIREE